MRCNVDLLKIIQVGITLADEEGNYPQDVSTWQFNFRFSVKYVYIPSTSRQWKHTERAVNPQRGHVCTRVNRVAPEVRHRVSAPRRVRNSAERLCGVVNNLWVSTVPRDQMDFIP